MHKASGITMKQSPANSTTVVGDERTVVAERTMEFLRRIHPHKTADNVSADTGIAASTIGRWLDRGSAPTSWAFLRLIAAYGPEFACAVMDHPPAWLDRAARDEESRRLRTQIEALQARLEGNAA
jgi:hypothetical protein